MANLRHKQRMTDRVKDGYFKYEPESHVPPGTPGTSRCLPTQELGLDQATAG